MRQPLSTSSFKKLSFFFIFFVVGLFALDRLAFTLLFPLYDNWFRVSTALSSSEILIVGSSHIESDFDVKLLSLLTKKSVGLFSLPGAGILPRYYGIKERLEESNVSLPKVVILETSDLIFHKSRYFDDESVQLIPYYHRNQFVDYIRIYGPPNQDWVWRNWFWTYSLNTYFSKLTDPLNVVRFFLEKTLSPQDYVTVRNRLRSIQTLCAGEGDPRIQDWIEIKNKIEKPNQIDEKKLSYFREAMDLLKKYPVKVYLFNPPFYRFKNEDPQAFENVRTELKSYENAQVSRLNLDLQNDSCLFTDDGHVGFKAQSILTQELAAKISHLL